MSSGDILRYLTSCLLFLWITSKHEVKQITQAGKQRGVYRKETRIYWSNKEVQEKKLRSIRACELKSRDLEWEETFQILRHCGWVRTETTSRTLSLSSTLIWLGYSVILVTMILPFRETPTKANNLTVHYRTPSKTHLQSWALTQRLSPNILCTPAPLIFTISAGLLFHDLYPSQFQPSSHPLTYPWHWKACLPPYFAFSVSSGFAVPPRETRLCWGAGSSDSFKKCAPFCPIGRSHR